jgi:hypothetical protein
MSEELAKSIQEKIEALLKANDDLSDLEIVREERQDLTTAVDISLKKLGLCLVVQTLDLTVSRPNLPGPIFDKNTVSVLVHENVLIWRSKNDRTAHEVAQQVASALHHKTAEGATAPLLCKGIFHQDTKGVLTYAVDFTIGT